MRVLTYLFVIALIAFGVALEAWVPFHPVPTFLILAGIVTISFLRKKAA